MHKIRQFAVLVGDITVLVGSFFITFFTRYRGHIPSDILDANLVPFIVLYILWVIIIYIFNLYDVHRIKPSFASFRQIVLALLASGTVGFLMFYLVPDLGITPKTTMLLNVLVFGILFIGWRTLFYRLFASRFQKKLVVIGTSDETILLVDEITKNPHIGYKYVGNFTSLQELSNKDISPDIIVLGNLPSTSDLLALSNIHADVIRISEAFQQMFFKIPVTLMDDQIAAKILEQKESHVYTILRRITEVIFAILVLVVTLPITVLTAIAILIDTGRPVFYTHLRVGRRKNIFKFIKFRSMIKDAEKNGAEWTQINDSRITAVGKIIRKLHIDEIPQVINILKGDLALVGPRAERPEFVMILEKEIPYYFLRHAIKPGFTGWAQIKFRYARTNLDSKNKFEYELFYLRNRNFFLDLGIILKTIQIIFTH